MLAGTRCQQMRTFTLCLDADAGGGTGGGTLTHAHMGVKAHNRPAALILFTLNEIHNQNESGET